MEAFETVTNSRWRPELRGNLVPIVLSGTEGSKSFGREGWIRLGVVDRSRFAKEQGRGEEVRDTESLLGSLLHELGHQFSNHEDRAFVREHFGSRIIDTDNEKIRTICKEAYVELVWKAVVDALFPHDRVEGWLERRRKGHKGVYDFIETLSEDERKQIVDRQYRDEVHGRKGIELSQSKFTQVRNLFSHLKKNRQ